MKEMGVVEPDAEQPLEGKLSEGQISSEDKDAAKELLKKIADKIDDKVK